jgi:hypothetical protein
MGKRAVLSVVLDKTRVLTKNNIPVRASKILPNISTFYGVDPSVGAVLQIIWVCVGGGGAVSVCRNHRFNANIGGGQSVAL